MFHTANVRYEAHHYGTYHQSKIDGRFRGAKIHIPFYLCEYVIIFLTGQWYYKLSIL